MTYLGHGFQLAVNLTHARYTLVSHTYSHVYCTAMFCLSLVLRPSTYIIDLAEVGALSVAHTIGGTGVLKIKLLQVASWETSRSEEAVNFSDLTSWPVP